MLPSRTAMLFVVVVAFSCRSVDIAQTRPEGNVDSERGNSPPLLQPGPPGEPTRPITPEKATDLSRIKYTLADVQFMQGMIGHHAQALEMTDLLFSRSNRVDMRLLAHRIEVSQADEINLMQNWLMVRDKEVPNPDPHHSQGTMLMPGMLTPKEMNHLAEATGSVFDRRFLEYMIKHHEGALIMVDELFSSPGAGQESEIFFFASDVDADQTIEINRMHRMLNTR